MDVSLESRATAAEELPRRSNSFDQLRLFAALLVLAGHSYPLTAQIAPAFLGRPLHGLGLEIFFAISGYLVAESLARDSNPLRFLAKRALRILPALWVATAVLLVFGLCVTSLAPIEYLTNAGTLSFLKNAVLDIHYALPGVFTGNPYPSAINGSWWSLPYEVTLYVALLACVVVGRRFGVAILVALYAGLTIAQQLGTGFGRSEQFLSISGLFVAGAALSALQGIVRPNAYVALVYLLAAFLLQNELQDWYMPMLLAYCVVSFGLQPNPMPELSRPLGDPSYGTYLYAFAVQQAIVALVPGIDPVVLTLLSAPPAIVLGILSWRIVERPALALKPRMPAIRSKPGMSVGTGQIAASVGRDA